MKWRRVQIALWLAAVALAGIAGVSFVHPFSTIISADTDRLYHVAIGDGNLRIVRLSAEFIASYTGETPLDVQARQWSEVPTKPLAWSTTKFTLSNGSPMHERVIGCTLFAPLVLMLVFKFLLIVRRLIRHRWRLVLAIREVFRPSDRHLVRLFHRFVRRSLIAIVALAAALAGGVLVIIYSGPPAPPWPGFSQLHFGRPWLRGSYRFEGRDYFFGSMIDFVPFSDHVKIHYTTRIPKRISVPDRDMTMAGLRWFQQVRPTPLTHSNLLTDEVRERLNTTNRLSLSLELPYWALVLLLLSSGWPVIAFVRGPWRRAGQRAKGLCLKCGYNLTGLISPRCPECGTPTLPGQIPPSDLVHDGGNRVRVVPQPEEP